MTAYYKLTFRVYLSLKIEADSSEALMTNMPAKLFRFSIAYSNQINDTTKLIKNCLPHLHNVYKSRNESNSFFKVFSKYNLF